MQNKKAIVAILLLAVTFTLQTILDLPFNVLGVSRGGDWWCCVWYHFFHANVFHLILNSLCLWSILRYDIRAVHLIAAFLIASASGILTAVDVPTVGASAFIVALSGIVSSWRVDIKSSLLTILLLTIYCLIPNINGAIHLAAWIGGFVFGRLRVLYLKYLYDSKGNNIREQ